MPVYLRDDMWAIHVTAENANGTKIPIDQISWAKAEGGDVEGQNQYLRPGGGQPGVNIGGPKIRSDMTVQRPYDATMHRLYVALDAEAGKGALHIAVTPLDGSYNPKIGGTITYHGVVKTVTRPNIDSTAEAAQYLSVVMGCHQDITTQS